MALAAAMACGGANGSNGIDGQTVVGPQGPSGAPGKNGTNAVAEAGAMGNPGDSGPIACGTVEIDPSVYGTACGGGTDGLTSGYDQSGNPVCLSGTVQCQYDVTTNALEEVCANSDGQFSGVYVGANQSTEFPVNPAPQAVGAWCNEDLNCDGQPDTTTGAGVNVVLIRAALTFECPSPVVNSQSDAGGAVTFLPGLCRNATEHCVAGTTWCDLRTDDGAVEVSCDGQGNPELGPVCAPGEGVVLSDFGITQFSDGSDGLTYGTPETCTPTN